MVPFYIDATYINDLSTFFSFFVLKIAIKNTLFLTSEFQLNLFIKNEAFLKKRISIYLKR